MKKTEFPPNWRLTTLGDIAREKPNNGIFRKNPEYLAEGSGGLPVVWVEELFRGNEIVTKDSRRVTATKGEVEKYGLKHGDILFCRSSLKLDGIAFNNVYLGEDNGALFECHLIRISPKLEVVSPVFLNWVLRSPQLRAIAKSKSKTATMTTIDQQSLGSISFPLPPLAEQRRIAEVLDKAEALRAKRRSALAQLESLTQSLFLDLFGDPVVNSKKWDRRPFSELLEAIDSGWSPVCLDRPATGDEWGILKLGAVTRCEYNASENKALPPNEEPDPSLEVKAGDLLFTRKNTYELVAACAFVRATPPKLMMSDLIFRLRLKDNAPVDKAFLQNLLVCPSKRSAIQKLAAGSSGSMPNISKARLLTVLIELPPLDLQHEFARRVAAVEKLKTAQRAALAELDTLFASLQHRAFRGEL